MTYKIFFKMKVGFRNIDDFDILMALDNTINIGLYNFLINNNHFDKLYHYVKVHSVC